MSLLSAAEFTMVEDGMAQRRERHESFLYLHITTAARARRAMDRAPSFEAFAHHERVRAQALAEASRHYTSLLNLGGLIDVLLAQLIEDEGGLTP